MTNIFLFVLALIAAAQGDTLNDVSSRIVNGTAVKLGEIPFQVSLQQDRFAFCGGSVISKYYIVTAAHCLVSKVAARIEVIAGTINWKNPGQVHQAEKLIINNKYNPSNSYANDVALVKVKTPFNFSNSLKPVPLPRLHEKVAARTIAVVSGWGRLGGLQNIKPDILYKAEILVADAEHCRNVMKERGMNITPGHLCANDPTTRRGQCTGDSGGPLTINGTLAGIVSWSIKDPYCASIKYPGVYTRVSEYVDWIRENAV